MFRRQVGIAKRHRGRGMPQEVADSGKRHPSHDEPGGQGVPQVVEVKVGQVSPLAGPFKGMPDIVVAPSFSTVKDLGHILAAAESAEQAPEGFIKRQRSCRPVLGLLQADKSLGHVDRVPGEGQQLFLAHPGMERREHNRLERVLTGREEPIGSSRSGQIPEPAGGLLILRNGGQFFPCSLP